MFGIKSIRGVGALIGLASAVAATDIRSAHAQLTLSLEQMEDAKNFVERAYNWYGTVTKILGMLIGSDGAATAAQLDKVQAAIIGEIQFWVGVELDAATTAAFEKYRAILANPNQTTSNRERVLFLTGSSSSNDAGDLFSELERILRDSRNVEMSYRLSTPFNTLSASMGHALAFHDKYFPEEAPFSWWSWNAHLGRTLRVNYSLVGAHGLQCWPGFHPSDSSRQINAYGTYYDSILWRGKIGNQCFPAAFVTCPSGHRFNVCYNPVTDHCPNCTTDCRSVGGGVGVITIGGVDYGTDFTQPYVRSVFKQRGVWLAHNAWLADPVVTNIRAAMVKIISQNVDGGDEMTGGGDPASPNGEFVDPWVDEPLCGANNPWAYPWGP